MKALVIGGTGFIGRRLVHYLLLDGHEVTIATRGKTENIHSDKVKSIKIDRFSRESISDTIKGDMHYDVVYDQIGFGADDIETSISALNGFFDHYIYTSSVAVYDGFKDGFTEEDFDPYAFQTREGGISTLGYAEGKRTAEAYLFKHSTVPSAAVRFPIVLGHDDVTGRVQFHTERIAGEKEIVVREPCGRMNYVWVEDAGRFLAWLGSRGKTGPYNAASPESIDAAGLINEVAAAMGMKASIVGNGRKEDESPYFIKGNKTVSVKKAMDGGFAFTPLSAVLSKVAKNALETGGKQMNTMDYLEDRISGNS